VRLELAERMQCPRPHRATPLIIVARRSVDRELVDGVAGCAECYLEAVITAGDVIFPGGDVPAPRVRPTSDASHALGGAPEPGSADPGPLTRLIALLGLAEPGGAVLLTGRYAALARGLTAAVDVTAVAWNVAVPRSASATDGASATPAPEEAPSLNVSAVWLPEPVVPFADGTFRGAALDATTPLPVMLDAVRAVSVGGRIVGAASLDRPASVRELARDAEEWVGEKISGASGVVPLRRA
jgi:hypothetical protein